MFTQPSRLQYGIKNVLEFTNIEVNLIDHHAVNKNIHANNDLNKTPHPKSSKYYLQNNTAFKRDIYNSKSSRIDVNYEDFSPMLAEKIATRTVDVMYFKQPIRDIPIQPRPVYGP